MRVYARKLIDENRQEEILPYLYCDSLSIQSDVAGLLFHCYPEECEAVLVKLSKMTIKTGLPRNLTNLSLEAYMTLIHGIPKDYP